MWVEAWESRTVRGVVYIGVIGHRAVHARDVWDARATHDPSKASPHTCAHTRTRAHAHTHTHASTHVYTDTYVRT